MKHRDTLKQSLMSSNRSTSFAIPKSNPLSQTQPTPAVADISSAANAVRKTMRRAKTLRIARSSKGSSSMDVDDVEAIKKAQEIVESKQQLTSTLTEVSENVRNLMAEWEGQATTQSERDIALNANKGQMRMLMEQYDAQNKSKGDAFTSLQSWLGKLQTSAPRVKHTSGVKDILSAAQQLLEKQKSSLDPETIAKRQAPMLKKFTSAFRCVRTMLSKYVQSIIHAATNYNNDSGAQNWTCHKFRPLYKVWPKLSKTLSLK